MNCPKCNSDSYSKNGVVNGLQRFKCKLCSYNFTVKQKSSSVDPNKKRIALILYLEGLKITTIAEMLEVSHVSVIKWIKKYGNNLNELRAQIIEQYDNFEEH
jgi:transposase-like protein